MKTLLALALVMFASSAIVTAVPAHATVCTRIGNSWFCN